MRPPTYCDQDQVNQLISENFERQFNNPLPSEESEPHSKDLGEIYLHANPEPKPVSNPSMKRGGLVHEAKKKILSDLNSKQRVSYAKDNKIPLRKVSINESECSRPEARLETPKLSIIKGLYPHDKMSFSRGYFRI